MSLSIRNSKLIEVLAATPVISLRELVEVFGNRMAISRLANDEQLVALGAGYYARPDVDRFTAAILVAGKYYPNTIISRWAALKMHGLVDGTPDQIDVDVPRSESLRNSLFTVHRVSPERLFGIETMSLQGIEVQVYDPERALCDVYRTLDDPREISASLSTYRSKGLKLERLVDYDRQLDTDVVGLLQRSQTERKKETRTTEQQAGPDGSSAVRQTIVEAACELYAREGFAGLTLRKVADEIGMSTAAIAYHFGSKSGLKRAVLNELNRFFVHPPPQIPDGLSPPEIITHFARETMAQAEASELKFRMERWCLAEQNFFIKDLIRDLCGMSVRFIANQITAACPTITLNEAQARGAFLLAGLDEYAQVYWIYSEYLGIETSKADMIMGYKRTLLERVIPALFQEDCWNNLIATQASRGPGQDTKGF